MPSLAELSDYYPQTDNTLPVAQPYLGVPQDADGLRRVYINTAAPAQLSSVAAPITDARPEPLAEPISPQSASITDKLFGLNGQERYQLWPEKVVREALAAPHDAMNTTVPVTSEDLIAPAQAVSALAGTGGLAGTGEGAGAALGAGPMLRPALKYEGKIYKAPIKDANNPLGFGAEHSDAIPAHLAEDFYKKAMSGEDINHYDFGFMNHKGQFLKREDALDYGIKEGLIDPQNAKYGTLTSTMLADSSKPGTAIEAMAKTTPFYSALEHNVNAISQGKMTGNQWLGTLSNKPGVKPEEMQWTGLKDFLEENKGKPVTKEQVQEHLQNNKIEIKDVNKGKGQEKAAVDNLEKAIPNGVMIKGEKLYADEVTRDLYNGDLKVSDLPTHLQAHGQNLMDNLGGDPTKYHSYQLPGGENYREKLLTLPDKIKLLEAYNSKDQYKSSHWDEPNILAHIRMNDRMIDGKKSLHLEEIQSDWHQQGKKAGYDDPTFRKAAEEKLNKAGYPVSGEDARSAFEDGKITKEEADAIGNRSYIPDAPFKKSWHELALKRMIREAAEKGYDRLSWTPGEAQAARYDLSKQVSEIHYNPNTGYTKILDKNGRDISTGPVAKDKLADTIGKEAANKLLESKPNNLGIHSLTGQDLKIGGEGMKGFYDQIIPKALEKISGEKIKTTKASETIVSIEKTEDGYAVSHKDNPHEYEGVFDTKKEAEDFIKEEFGGEGLHDPRNSTPIHYIDLPQSLKDKALSKGFPLFSSSHMFTPVVGNPFQSDKK